MNLKKVNTKIKYKNNIKNNLYKIINVNKKTYLYNILNFHKSFIKFPFKTKKIIKKFISKKIKYLRILNLR